MMTCDDYARIAYESWVEYLIDNKYELGIRPSNTLPEWDKLPRRMQQAWERVAETLFRQYRRELERST